MLQFIIGNFLKLKYLTQNDLFLNSILFFCFPGRNRMSLNLPLQIRLLEETSTAHDDVGMKMMVYKMYL